MVALIRSFSSSDRIPYKWQGRVSQGKRGGFSSVSLTATDGRVGAKAFWHLPSALIDALIKRVDYSNTQLWQ